MATRLWSVFPMNFLLNSAAQFTTTTGGMPYVRQPNPGEEYIDPAFGGRVTRITASDPADGEYAVIKPMYSTIPAWNADESRLLLWSRKDGHVLYEGDRPYRRIGTLDPYHPTDIESVLWDPQDPQQLYYPSNLNAEPEFWRQSIAPKALGKLCDFTIIPPKLPSGDWKSLLSLGSDPQWITRGPKSFVGMKCGNTTFTYSITEGCAFLTHTLPEIYKNAFMVTPSERFVQLDRYVFDMDLSLHGILGMSNPYEHACPGLLMDGVDTWNTVDFAHPTKKGSLVSYRVDTGAAKVVIGPSTGYPYPPAATHISAIGPPEWVAVGMVGTGMGDSPLDNEIVLANVMSGAVYRLAHCRSLSSNGRWGYWSETHVTISPSGTRILFGSDWGGGPTVDTYVIDLRKERP